MYKNLLYRSYYFSYKRQKKIYVSQPRPSHILYQCAKFGDDWTLFNFFFMCVTFNM